MITLDELLTNRDSFKLSNKKTIDYIDKLKLNKEVVNKTNNIFESYNCLECGNCCKSYKPIIYIDDINSISTNLNLTPAKFISLYLEMDEDGDFVFTGNICPFFSLQDHKCNIYKFRPYSCADYPHLSSTEIDFDIMFQNSLSCPAVTTIIQQIEQDLDL